MKKLLVVPSLLLSLLTFGQKRLNEIKTFEGRFTQACMFEGECSFTINNVKFVVTGGPKDKRIEIEVDGDLYNNIITGYLPKGTKLRVKAKTLYAFISPLCSDCSSYKKLVWKPIKIELAK